MSQKELLYFEDAINHETSIISILDNMTNNLEDEDLIKFVQGEIKSHKTTKEKLLKKLGGCSNG